MPVALAPPVPSRKATREQVTLASPATVLQPGGLRLQLPLFPGTLALGPALLGPRGQTPLPRSKAGGQVKVRTLVRSKKVSS